MNILERN